MSGPAYARPVRRELVSPLSTWLPDASALAALRRRLDTRAVVLAPRDRAWRAIAPGFAECVALVAGGLPFHIAADLRYDRSGERRRLRPALASGKTVFVPQIHQVLPRLARLMVALRAGVLGPRREELSYLFMVEGRGRPAMGLHHDGEVDSFWLQLEGRRTVTLGPRVRRGTPKDMRGRALGPARRARWRTFELEPGTLFYMPARTPHDVICRERSLAVSMTWSRAGYRTVAAATRALVAWDVVSGLAAPPAPTGLDRLWTQVPVFVPAAGGAIETANGRVFLPVAARRVARRLSTMPSVSRRALAAAPLALLTDSGLLGAHDLPLTIAPERPGELEGWAFG